MRLETLNDVMVEEDKALFLMKVKIEEVVLSQQDDAQ